MGTRPEYRRRGVASALISRARRAAAEQGYDQASLQVDSENAAEVFEKAGFVPKMRYVRWALEA